MQYKVQSYIEKQQLLSPGASLIVGVSGGADSVALLHILHSLGYNCIIAHCNFKLRKDESDRDEIFVRTLADEMKIPAHFIDFKTTEYAVAQKISIEMAARELRYAWFEELRLQYDATAIAVAHHADDSIETLLMNLIRGTGLRGMTGIPPRNGKVVRPLLCCSREEILAYLMKYDLAFVEDSTNASSDYTRNKFRNEVLPLLEEINPSVRRVLYETIQRFEGIQAVFQQALTDSSLQIVENSPKGFKIDIGKLKLQADVPTVLYELISPYGFHPDQILSIVKHLDSEPGKLFYSDSHCLIKDRKYLIINTKSEVNSHEYRIDENNLEIFEPVHLQIKLFERNSDFVISRETDRIHIDADKIQFPLTLRHWNEGDSFVPFGMQGRKKVSDFFIDIKLNLNEKNQALLLLSGNDIVWILGYRTDNRFKVSDKTKRVLEITYDTSAVI
ncbi:MAG: tRNA lysidine(34) synthetase TilS [Bacteroidales bacterium]|nr:tRNA lysidine(34) synthetase TilS [Bacteroidales bacterium]